MIDTRCIRNTQMNDSAICGETFDLPQMPQLKIKPESLVHTIKLKQIHVNVNPDGLILGIKARVNNQAIIFGKSDGLWHTLEIPRTFHKIRYYRGSFYVRQIQIMSPENVVLS